MNRNTLRKDILAARDRMPDQERRLKSQSAHANLKQLDAFQKCKALFSYVNYRSELETLDIITDFLHLGRTVAVPLTIINKGLEAYVIKDLENDLAPGYCSILEPRTDRTDLFEPQKIDLVLLPGSVFDRFGGRLGYGGGYYDRFLSQDTPHALRVGLAFEMQLVDCVPTRTHDIPVDYLVTEKRLICTAKNRS